MVAGSARGSTAVDLLRRWAPLVAMAEFGDSAATVALSWVLSVRGRKSVGREREGGEKKCPVFVNRVTGLTPIFRCGMFD